MIIVEGVARNLDPNINFWEVSKPEIEEWLRDELGIKNRLKETQETLKSLARRVPDLPNFLSRAENAIDTISEITKEKEPSSNYIFKGGAIVIIILGIIALI
jgi:ubiquinone biosynthesis protein